MNTSAACTMPRDGFFSPGAGRLLRLGASGTNANRLVLRGVATPDASSARLQHRAASWSPSRTRRLRGLAGEQLAAREHFSSARGVRALGDARPRAPPTGDARRARGKGPRASSRRNRDSRSDESSSKALLRRRRSAPARDVHRASRARPPQVRAARHDLDLERARSRRTALAPSASAYSNSMRRSTRADPHVASSGVCSFAKDLLLAASFDAAVARPPPSPGGSASRSAVGRDPHRVLRGHAPVLEELARAAHALRPLEALQRGRRRFVDSWRFVIRLPPAAAAAAGNP